MKRRRKTVAQVCKNCHNVFQTRTDRVAEGMGEYCSRECSNLGRRKNRVWAKCDECGIRFACKRERLERGYHRFCSKKCNIIGINPRPELVDVGTHIELVLPCGQRALIDHDDRFRVGFRRWHGAGNGYIKSNNPNKRFVYLHRFILRISDSSVMADHKNGNKLDNRKSNLRIADYVTNAWNTVRNKTQFPPGAARCGKRWKATICCDGKRIHLGVFDTPEEASRVYVEAKDRMCGEFSPMSRV